MNDKICHWVCAEVAFTLDLSHFNRQFVDRGEIRSNGFVLCHTVYLANSWHVSTLLQDVDAES